MNKKMLTLAVALLAASSSASAAESATLEVTGTITPPPCTIGLDGTGMVNLGEIKTESLSTTVPTKLTTQSTDLSVSCPGKSQFAISAVDARSANLVDAAVGVAKTGATSDQAFGLGSEDGQDVGAYVISLASPITDNGSSSMITRTSGGSWSAATVLQPGDGQQTAWGNNQAVTATKDAKVTLNVDAAIASLSELDLSNSIDIQGQATIELTVL